MTNFPMIDAGRPRGGFSKEFIAVSALGVLAVVVVAGVWVWRGADKSQQPIIAVVPPNGQGLGGAPHATPIGIETVRPLLNHVALANVVYADVSSGLTDSRDGTPLSVLRSSLAHAPEKLRKLQALNVRIVLPSSREGWDKQNGNDEAVFFLARGTGAEPPSAADAVVGYQSRNLVITSLADHPTSGFEWEVLDLLTIPVDVPERPADSTAVTIR